MRKFKRIILTLSMVTLAFAPTAVVTGSALAAVSPQDISNNLCSGSNFDITGATQGCDAGASSGDLNNLLSKIINIFSAIVGVIAVVMIIVGGLRYITSGGDSGRVSAAKTTIIYALVGLVIVALAQLIVHFVLTQSSTLGQ